MSDEQVIAGRYRLHEQLGSGGMGVVWRALDERLRRTVAVKQVHVPTGLTDSQSDELIRRTMREGRIAARLHHPQLITMYDVIQDGGRPYLIMEHFPSTSLADLGTLPYAEVAHIGAEAAAALAAAHRSGVVHRDIKPANLLVGADGTVKITDFGISRVVEDLTATMTGMFAGTPAYLAPEVAKGGQATFASDVYALGATLYAVVEGAPPSGRDTNPMALLYRVASGEVRPPQQAGPLTDVLMWLLNTDPAARPTMAQAVPALAAVAKAAGGGDRATWVAAAAGNGSAPAQQDEPAAEPAAEEVAEPAELAEAPEAPVEADGGATTALPESLPEDEKPADPPVPTDDAPDTPPPAPESTPAAPTAAFRPSAPATAPAPAHDRRRRLRIAAVAAGLVVIALVATLATSLLNGDDEPGRQQGGGAPGSTTSAPTAGETSAEGTTEGEEPTTTGSEATTTQEPPPQTQNPPPAAPTPGEALTAYYALLPGNREQAWQLLTPKYQNYPARGRDGYERFWNQFTSVTVSEVVATGETAVEATIVYTFTDGRSEQERHRYLLVNQNGTWMIDESTVL